MGCTLYLTLVGIPSTTGPTWQKLFLDAWLLFFLLLDKKNNILLLSFISIYIYMGCMTGYNRDA